MGRAMSEGLSSCGGREDRRGTGVCSNCAIGQLQENVATAVQENRQPAIRGSAGRALALVLEECTVLQRQGVMLKLWHSDEHMYHHATRTGAMPRRGKTSLSRARSARTPKRAFHVGTAATILRTGCIVESEVSQISAAIQATLRRITRTTPFPLLQPQSVSPVLA